MTIFFLNFGTRNRIFARKWGRTRIRSAFDIVELTARLSIQNRPMLCKLHAMILGETWPHSQRVAMCRERDYTGSNRS